MKTYTIAIQDGLEAIKQALSEKGHNIIPYGESVNSADVIVMSGIDSAYEEIENAQCMIKDSNGSEVLLINATGMNPEQVLKHIENNRCL